MDVRDLTVLGLLDERRSSDVVPHLAGDHREHEEQGDEAPHVLVVQELEVVAAKVQKAGNLSAQKNGL